MRLLSFLLATIFTFVSIGGNIYVHKCKDATLLSLYEKVNADSCPFCEKHQNADFKNENHCKGECKDAVLKLDQLTDKNFNVTQTFFTQLSPAIIPILWVVNFSYLIDPFFSTYSSQLLYSSSDSSPPIYIHNCIFRI